MNRILLRITRHCLLVVTLAEMAKTHLEHQLIRFKQNKYGNATTAKYDPYANYNPQEGITTALILGKLPSVSTGGGLLLVDLQKNFWGWLLSNENLSELIFTKFSLVKLLISF